jgi:HD superfamily phosphohydrolase
MNKLIKDPIHGFVQLDELALSIVDTPIFQRLRKIKQLGLCDLVYPSACHSRFEHSVGVYHLAKEMASSLQSRQPELNITNRQIDLLAIAGLVHDLGHVMFSHVFENVIAKSLSIEIIDHEDLSKDLFKDLVDKYKIKLSKDEVEIICNMIDPPDNLKNNFLYQIVCNKKSSVDVDKFDYICRDSYHIGLSYKFDFSRIIMQVRVINNQICFPDKLSFDLHELFYTRYRLHKQVYSHKVVRNLELLVGDIILNFKDHLQIEEKYSDYNKIIYLTDDILYLLEHNIDNFNEEQVTLINKFSHRKGYKFIGEIVSKCDCNYKQDFLKYINDSSIELDILVDEIKIGLTGSKNLIPTDEVLFYQLKDPGNFFKIKKEDISFLISSNVCEYIYRFYSRLDDYEINKHLISSFLLFIDEIKK